MRLLLDTHAFLWYVFGQKELSPVALIAILDPNSEIYVSLVSMWEAAIKHARGRLELKSDPSVFFDREMKKNGFRLLSLEPGHVFTAAALPLGDHRDPFDRALAAQAKAEGLILVSADAKMDQYGVSRLF